MNEAYEKMRAEHEWRVPDRYNIAQDVCDKHPRDKLAMIWEDWQGNERRVEWGEHRTSRTSSRTCSRQTA